MLAHKHVPHSFGEVKEASHGLAFRTTDQLLRALLVTGIKPPLKGTPLAFLECLGMVCAVTDLTQVLLSLLRENP